MINLPTSVEGITEETKRAFKAFDLQKTIEQATLAVSCSDLSAIQAIQLPSECTDFPDGRLSCKGRDMEGAVTLDWRADPFTSMSDLTLLVYDGSGSGGVPYYVHTLLLVHGGRKSGFVIEQVKLQNNGKRSDYKIELYLPPLAAKHIPAFLNYVYGKELKITTSNAPPLRYLANRFDLRDLYKDISTKFIPRDLEIGTAPMYCKLADELKDYELRDRAIKLMAERMDKLNINSVKHLSPRLMRSLVQCEKLECSSEDLSEKVATWLRLRRELEQARDEALIGANTTAVDESRNASSTRKDDDETMTDEDFYWLTHVQFMPRIAPSEALFYLKFGSQFPQVMKEVGSGSLKPRCLAAFSGKWAVDKLAEHVESKHAKPFDLYEDLDLASKVELLEASLVGAKKLLTEKDEASKQRVIKDKDAKRSDDIMYKTNHESSSSSSPADKILKVVVMGCGIQPANGIYIYKESGLDERTSSGSSKLISNNNNSTIVYEKEAIWNQKRVTFVLYPTTAGQYYSQHKLAVRQRNSHKMQTLYNSPTVMGLSGVIPELAWEVEGDNMEGIHPPPQFVGKIEQPPA
eukprot:CAMPEP_0201717660 /NCGR_PEP_ID=MMETSP0593-20130828/3342_1 /ASSEMBLY_ACC=CAM_ASM_000672 /TAXON_ID=267983 /ORGANISM="Skeletonema japonicum, Strain CCMP2506" /LENGTH=576 /DNA_ID=CAMNT_0048207769 /DNA_START=40 /DNA_END=1767 /DNA_ORIENTATION=-